MAIAFTDAKTTGNPIIFVNGSFLELTGYSRSEVLGQNFNILLANADNYLAAALVNAPLASQQTLAPGVLPVAQRQN